MSFPTFELAMSSRPPSGIASPHKMRSRTQSISSDRPSTISYNLMSPPLSVSPEACFIAGSAASQIVTNDHDGHADTWYDQNGVEPSGETALVSPGALNLVNSFLDQLLFNFLCISRSTNLTSLRPAVSEVLKPKLAKDAINQADEELREYLGGGDDDDTTPNQASGSPRDWDLELVWKRTRLRCMVYSSLGDMEEEDEDFYMEQEHLDGGLEDRPAEAVSPAVAIFLTSILEFMGEQALIISGQAAYNRMRVKYEKELKDGARSPGDMADRIVVEELDMERVALDRTLGRLWRAWKKKIRSPGLDKSMSRPYSRDSMRPGHMRQSSFTESFVPATVQEPEAGAESDAENKTLTEELVEEEPVEEHILAANIPLPIGDNDVEEIEVPWLVDYSDDEETLEDEDISPPRPKSLTILPLSFFAADLPTLDRSSSPISLAPLRKRSNSLPTRAVPLYTPEVVAEMIEDVNKDDDLNSDEVESAESVATSPTTSQAEEQSESGHSRQSSGVPAILAGAAGVGSAAVAATAKLPVLQTDLDQSEHGDGEYEEDFVEEPQILTSSRISISGPSTSPALSENGWATPANSGLPVRSPSVHSLRLIDVSGPRSPSTRSWTGSMDAGDHGRNGPLSATNSVRTPVIAEESRPPTRDPVGQASPDLGVYIGRAISNVEEVAVVDHVLPVASAVEPVEPLANVVSKPKASDPYDDLESEVYASQPIFGSVIRHKSPPSSPVKQPTTKVTILQSSTTTPGTFFLDDKPNVPEKPPAHLRHPVPALATNVPERSPTRQSNASLSPTHAQSSQQTSIGVVSVERTRTRTASEISGSQSQEQVSRHLHTSGSASTTSTNRLRPVRASEDSANKADVARNFEELIHSDQTIQYTLTPENMRDIESQSSRSMSTGSPIVPVKSRKSEDARLTGERSRSSSVNRPSDLRRSTSVTQSSILREHPAGDAHANGGSLNGPIPRSSVADAPKSRVNAPQPRDARLPRESLADFAEFIRSTGPPGESSMNGNAYARAAGPGAMRNPGGPVPVTKESMDSSRASTSTANRMRLQARDAAVSRGDDNSDLIDFIRRGPPAVVGNRIPRTVAPFRTTMDSDQMSAAVGGRAVDAQIRDIDVRGSETSTTTDYSMPSAQASSINSQTALLRNKALPTQNGNRQGTRDPDMPMPPRKSRRVRDPYAIDFSDEEDADTVPLPTIQSRRAAAAAAAPSPPAREESLADFLKDYAPPPEVPVQPFILSQNQNRPKKKASAPSLMARLTRRESSQTTASNGNRSPKPVPDARSSNSRSGAVGAGGGGRGYIPIQVNMPPGVDKYSPSYGSSKPMPSMGGGPPGSAGRVRMKKFEPRDAVAVPSRSGTSDLAEFLRNSAPPPGAISPSAISPDAYSSKGESGGFSKVFSSRRKPNLA